MASLSSFRHYDVFLSFRGEDTRKKFVSHLYNRLMDKSIRTFKDDRELHLGGSLPHELPKAIEESKFAVVVISQNYASSRWCLKELRIIMDRVIDKRLEVIPIFYDVDPSDVRHLRGTFAEAFQEYEGKEEPATIQNWREALAEIADLTGIDSKKWQDEATMVSHIADDISKQLLSLFPKDNSDIFGMDAHLKSLEPFLSMESGDEARMIGIWGMGGIGKTTIAKCLYDKLKCRFHFHYFIENVKKIFSEQGWEHLQRQFLSGILRDENLKSQNFKIDSTIIKARLGTEKVLVILDDVDELSQLQALAKETDWFGPGSIIIITTRDKGLLVSHKIEHVYKVKYMDGNTACRLFNHFALGKFCGKEQLPDAFKELSICASRAVKGLPLALKVLGLYLRGREVEEWKDAISKLRGSPRENILRSLKVSYDGLDVWNKSILLTVACLFTEEKLCSVSRLLDDEEEKVRNNLRMLAEKALIEISNDGRVKMHDLIQEMAKDIVYEESPNNPGRRRFLWDAEEIYNVLEDGTGTDAIEGILLDMQKMPKCPTRKGALENMPNLKFLSIQKTDICCKNLSKIHAVFNHLPLRLRLLDWEFCPLKTLPSGFRAECLVELWLPYGKLETLSEETLLLGNLRKMDLDQNRHLKKISGIFGATKLEELNLSRCHRLMVDPPFTYASYNLAALKRLNLNLCFNKANIPLRKLTTLNSLSLRGFHRVSDISTTIGDLTNLKMLDLSFCYNVKNIPNTIGKLTTLERLSLMRCCRLSRIPSTIGNMAALIKLNLSYCTRLEELPDTIGKLTALKVLSVKACVRLSMIPTTIGDLATLIELDLSSCCDLLNIPDTIGKLTTLEILRLGSCAWRLSIPTTIGNLISLKDLDLSYCMSLKNIPITIGNLTTLKSLNLRCCLELSSIPNTICNLTSLKKLDLRRCVKLGDMSDTLESLAALKTLELLL